MIDYVATQVINWLFTNINNIRNTKILQLRFIEISAMPIHKNSHECLAELFCIETHKKKLNYAVRF